MNRRIANLTNKRELAKRELVLDILLYFVNIFSITYSQGRESMGATSKESVKRKVFPKGQIVIPVALRKKY
ncbi:MAG: hypothetical protein L6263_11945, partial [Desulfobacteraceae bacterium]|nr:hypothetical protein [Desulfobacteraceae bacterium]